jgi:hypothetical protein
MPWKFLKGPRGRRHRSTPSTEQAISPKSGKNAKTERPSVTGVGDAALFRSW